MVQCWVVLDRFACVPGGLLVCPVRTSKLARQVHTIKATTGMMVAANYLVCIPDGLLVRQVRTSKLATYMTVVGVTVAIVTLIVMLVRFGVEYHPMPAIEVLQEVTDILIIAVRPISILILSRSSCVITVLAY